MDSICNLTVEEFLDRTPENDGFTFTVRHHKTEKKDHVYLYVDRSLYNMINTFYHGIRKEQQLKPNFHGLYMFCAVNGEHLRRITGSCEIINKFIKDNGKLLFAISLCDDHWWLIFLHVLDLGNVGITPSDTRFLFSNWDEGCNSEDISLQWT